LRGGYIELFRLKFVLEENPGWRIFFADANSLYGHVAINNAFPVGKYQILLPKDNIEEKITFKDGKFLFQNQSMVGDAAHVTLLAPSHLFRPFLQYRVNDEFNYLFLCRKCAVEKIARHCAHRKEEVRSFSSCYQITDLEKAVSLGYSVLHFHELHHYQKRDYILRDFVKILASEKLKVSNILEGIESDQEKFCSEINEKMEFQSEDCLQPGSVIDNKGLKALYKNMLVSLFGRFALHSNFSKHFFVRSAYEISQQASKPHVELLDLFEVSENICQIEISNGAKIRPSSDGCLYITSEINSLSRKFIYEKAESIERLNGIILSVDTDSLLFALPPGVSDPLIYGSEFGSFKSVLGEGCEINKFYSLAPRNYALAYKDSNGCERSLVKIKGLSLTSVNNSTIIDIDSYSDLVEKRFKNEVENIYVPQMRKKTDKQKKTLTHVLTKFDFSNELHVKRYCIANDKTHTTYPYGWKFLKN
jgi:hypothetical protein